MAERTSSYSVKQEEEDYRIVVSNTDDEEEEFFDLQEKTRFWTSNRGRWEVRLQGQ